LRGQEGQLIAESPDAELRGVAGGREEVFGSAVGVDPIRELGVDPGLDSQGGSRWGRGFGQKSGPQIPK
jgi:hypothetical protein